MSERRKLYLAAAAFLLLALGVLLRPSAPSPTVSAVPAERSRYANRASNPAIDPRRAKDFHTFVQRSTQAGFPQLTREEIDKYLETQHRSAGSLLAAFRLSKDETLLREAMGKFPLDPQVLLASLELSDNPSKRLEILESLKRADPANSLADCLSARILFDLGRNEEALAALSESAGKQIRDFTVLSCQDVEEAYLAAGFSALEAKAAALHQSTKPLLMQMPNVADGLKKLRASDQAAGDDEAVQSSRDIQLEIARQLQQGGFLVYSMVAILLEKRVLKEIDSPESIARMEEMELQKKSMYDDAKRISTLMETSAVPESDWLFYFDRVKLFAKKRLTIGC